MMGVSKSPISRSAAEALRESLPSAPQRKVRAWEVVHACDFARDIADLVEAQIEAGMRPYLLTVGADTRANASILQAWQDVRKWKKALDESGAHATPDLIHAHSFSAGMAAVRMGACLVYDLRRSIEERLAQSAPGTWATRSFRTAEQFVLSKAAAVVVHAAEVREDCIARGLAAGNVFVVPDPLPAENGSNVIHLAESSEKREQEVRSPHNIALRYDEVYRYAFSRRRRGDDARDSSGALIPIPANL